MPGSTARLGRSFISTRRLWARTGIGLFSEVQKEINKHVFLLAKHLKEPLTQSAKTGHGAFMVVLQLDGEFGLGGEIDFDPITGGLFGLVKTLNLEWESVFCRAVDISPEVAEDQAVRHIIAELFDPNRLVTEVGYSAKGRATLVAEQAAEQAWKVRWFHDPSSSRSTLIRGIGERRRARNHRAVRGQTGRARRR